MILNYIVRISSEIMVKKKTTQKQHRDFAVSFAATKLLIKKGSRKTNYKEKQKNSKK